MITTPKIKTELDLDDIDEDVKTDPDGYVYVVDPGEEEDNRDLVDIFGDSEK